MQPFIFTFCLKLIVPFQFFFTHPFFFKCIYLNLVKLGKCRRFRLVTFRDNEVWKNSEIKSQISNADLTKTENGEESVKDPNISVPNYMRQAALAANLLDEGVHDSKRAMKCGLAKRGVAVTYCMVEGCPKDLGCTVLLRGASRIALKQVKKVFSFLVNIAYNLRLETSFLMCRRAKLPPEYVARPQFTSSSSLCKYSFPNFDVT